MILAVARERPGVDEIPGRLLLDGREVCRCVESLQHALPVGSHPVSIRGDAPGETTSPKFGRPVVWIEAGRGWTYIHYLRPMAGRLLEGCVGVPSMALETWIRGQVEAAIRSGRPVWITICEPPSI